MAPRQGKHLTGIGSLAASFLLVGATLTAAPAMAGASAASKCPRHDGNVCWWTGEHHTGHFWSTGAVTDQCLRVDDAHHWTARFAWNRSGHKLTVYETSTCGGHYDSVAADGKINRATWEIRSFKLTS